MQQRYIHFILLERRVINYAENCLVVISGALYRFIWLY